ncbi:MAG TPA: hypothetical protein VII54_05450 [Gaiellaceae bacterium]
MRRCRRDISGSESKHPARERSLDGHDDESGCTEDKDAEADTGGYKTPPLHSRLASDKQCRPCAGCGNAREKQDYESRIRGTRTRLYDRHSPRRTGTELTHPAGTIEGFELWNPANLGYLANDALCPLSTPKAPAESIGRGFLTPG